MCKAPHLLLLFATLLPLAAYAGHGTIRETETAIIIEYEGDEADVKAAQAEKKQQQLSDQAADAAVQEREKATAVKITVESTPENIAAQRAKSTARRRRDAGEAAK